MVNPKPLRAGDVVQLIAPGYGEPDGLCTVVADQQSPYVWFTPKPTASSPCYVARHQALRMVRRV